jgi:lipoprotein-releasing system permease protein
MTKPSGTQPFAPFEWMLSLRYLRARRQEGFISVNAGFSFLGIMLGVATLIIVMAVLNGFRKELLEKILGLNGHLLVQPLERPLTDWQEVAERISKVPGVKLATPIVDGKALASVTSGGEAVMVRGIRGQDLGKLEAVADNIKAGSLAGFDKGEGVAIGKRLAEKLSVSAGDSLSLLTPHGVVGVFGVLPRIKSYKVAAVFEVGMFEFDTAFVFMPLPESQAYFNRSNGDVTTIAVYVTDPDQVDRYRELVSIAAERPLAVFDWRQFNTTFFGVLKVQRNVMFFIVTIIVIVAVFNITSGLFMLVKDKGPAIGILRTIGATRTAVMRVFIITGTTIGAVGTLVGLVLGAVISHYAEAIRQGISWLTGVEIFEGKLYFLNQLPAEMDMGETAAVVAMALTLSLLATLYPSWRAARLDPVEALRYE